MSVRIYQLSKKLGLSNKEVIELLKKRGLDVKSPSSTIPNIYADSILEEYGFGPITESEEAPVEEKKSAPVTKQKSKFVLPKGPIVRSADDIAKGKAAAQKFVQVQPAVFADIKPTATAPQTTSKAAPVISARPHIAGTAPKMPPIINRPQLSPTSAPVIHKPEVTYQEERKSISAIAPISHPALKASEQAKTSELTILHCKPPLVVREFAQQMDIKPFKLISELMEMGIFASMNQTIEEKVALKIAAKHGFLLEVHHRGGQQIEVQQKKIEKPVIDEKQFLEPRPPVVCVLGHVDHGKTTLLDAIRKTNVVAGEAGGITQHIGAYQVEHNNHKITFIDTPGHAAFSKMRQRGAELTDIAILVVAADDGFMPQTDEALKFAKNANVPVVVAINKMDARGANIDRVKQQMQERQITSEDWGGETLTVPISALKGDNIDELLNQVLLQAEIEELKANPKCPAEGLVVESQVEVGRGTTATVIVQRGTLKPGDAVVCGQAFCKVRAMMDDAGNRLTQATPGTPARILGWAQTPESGAAFKVVKNEREAKAIAEDARHEAKLLSAAEAKYNAPVDLENLFKAMATAEKKTLKVVVKGDVHGSVEAIIECLKNIKSDKVGLEIIYGDIGQISKTDIQNASAAGGVIVGFNTKVEPGAQTLAKQEGIKIVMHSIIYELIENVKESMAELLDPELKENKLGAAEVRQVFAVTKGAVAGCMITEGKIQRDMFARIFRGKKRVMTHESKVVTLKRFKDDAAEVRAGYECGIQISGFSSYEVGDIIECFEIQKIRPSL